MWARIFRDLGERATLSVGRRRESHSARNVAIALAAVGGIGIAALLSKRAHPR